MPYTQSFINDSAKTKIVVCLNHGINMFLSGGDPYCPVLTCFTFNLIKIDCIIRNHIQRIATPIVVSTATFKKYQTHKFVLGPPLRGLPAI